MPAPMYMYLSANVDADSVPRDTVRTRSEEGLLQAPLPSENLGKGQQQAHRQKQLQLDLLNLMALADHLHIDRYVDTMLQ